MAAPHRVRVATESDAADLTKLIERSARVLSRGYYNDVETESAIRYVFGVDSTLVADRTYFVAEENGALLGCGGWSKRRTLYGGDQRPVGAQELLDPARDAARIRAFFVAPEAARRGVGRSLLDECVKAATDAGFKSLELMSTLPGVPFYAALGFEEVEPVTDTLPDGVALRFVRMRRGLAELVPTVRLRPVHFILSDHDVARPLVATTGQPGGHMCFENCLRRWLNTILIAAGLGAFIGAVLAVVLTCAAVGGILGAAGGPAGAIGGAIACTAVELTLLLPWVILGAIIGALIGGGALLATALVACGLECAAAAPAGAAPGTSEAGLFGDGPLTCESAEAAVAALEQQLAQARAARDAQRDLVAMRRNQLNNRRNILLAAIAALAIALVLNPFGAMAAAAAVAAAFTAVVAAGRRYAEAQIRLTQLEATVAALEAALAVARAARDAICGTGDSGDDNPPLNEPGGGLGPPGTAGTPGLIG